jgi:catechol 2,3-dioxygenase-like lactoylglutathione lyase family enzyme
VPTRIRGLAEIVLTTHDMAAALRFYRETLGLEQISPPERPGPVFLKAGERSDAFNGLTVGGEWEARITGGRSSAPNRIPLLVTYDFE